MRDFKDSIRRMRKSTSDTSANERATNDKQEFFGLLQEKKSPLITPSHYNFKT